MIFPAFDDHVWAISRHAGVDTPRTAFVHAREDLEEAASHVPFPALFKPLRHQESRRRFGVKVILVPTADDQGPAYEKARACGPLMLQEIIPGEDHDV